MADRPRAYLDHNATSPLRPQARQAMERAMDIAGNPSSVHREGREARAAVERARAQVAALAGCRENEIVFTSGASEANATVLAGDFDIIVTSAMEHESVLAHARRQRERGRRVIEVGATAHGQVSLDDLEAALADLAPSRGAGRRGLASLQLANGETGAVQPLARFAAIARANGFLVHSDAVQAAGRLPLDLADMDVDFLSLSAHKIGGPKGVGALVIRDGATLDPLVLGGGQEGRRRAGTENVVGIVAFGAAAEAARRDLADMARLAALRDRLEREALAMGLPVEVIACGAQRIANTSALALSGAKAETIVIAFDLAGVAISAGSACSSGKVAASHVMSAIGVGPDKAAGVFRVSLGWSTTEADIERFVDALSAIVARYERRTVA